MRRSDLPPAAAGPPRETPAPPPPTRRSPWRGKEALWCLLPHLGAFAFAAFLLRRMTAPPHPAFWLLPWWLGTGLAGSLVLDPMLRRRLLPARGSARRAVIGGLLAFEGFGALIWFPRVLHPGHILALLYGAGLGTLARLAWLRAVRCSRAPWSEALRGAGLTAAGLALALPLLVPALVGGGDALHYALRLADFIAQVRQGVFPVLIGQTDFAFYGDMHPLRTAPYFPYAGGLLNFLTAGALPAYAVQNLVLALHLLAAGFAAYGAALALTPRQPWQAWLLALLYLTCPGILALLYGGDMVISWMALPWLPLLFLGAIQAVRQPHRPGWLAWMAATLAALWLAHAGIAFWATLAAAPFAFAAIVRRWNGPRSLWAPAGAGVWFLLLAAYEFASVLLLRIPADPNRHLAIAHGAVLDSLRHGWTGFLHPVSPSGADLLADVQLSAGLWVAAVLGWAGLWRRERLLAGIMGVVLLAGLALLAPIPAVAGRLWPALPDFVTATTDEWPMLRFYVILAALVAGGAGLGLAAWGRWGRRVSLALLAAGCLWSGWEARRFIQRGWAITSPPGISALRLRPENAVPSRYTYEYFGHLPRYFNPGTTGPYFENHLLDADSLEPLPADLTRLANDGTTRHEFTPTNYGGFFHPRLELAPGQLYLVDLDFQGRRPIGALQLAGRAILREYWLPAAGEERAFGADPGRPHDFALWISGHQADSVEAKFIRTSPDKSEPLAMDLRLVRLRPSSLPAEVRRLVPYRLTVRAPRASWLETPKVFLPGYRAAVNGRPAEISPSPDGLVMVPVPAGVSDVVVNYPGPPGLRLAFWLCAAAWLAALLAVLDVARGTRSWWRRQERFLLETSARIGLGTAVVAAAAFGAARGVAAWRAPPAPAHGPLWLALSLPIGAQGRSEPVLTVGTGAAAEVVFVNYLDGKNVRIGCAAAGGARLLSDPIPVNYLADQQLEISLGALFAADARPPAGSADERAWSARRRRVTIRLNHRLAIDAPDPLGAPEDATITWGCNLVPLPDVADRFTGRLLDRQRRP